MSQNKRPFIQWTTRMLLLATLFAAVAVCALRNASPAWSEFVFYVNICLLIAAIFVFGNSSGQRRAFCVGYSVFCMTHMFLCWSPGLARGFPELDGRSFVTTRLSESLYDRVQLQLTIKPLVVSSREELQLVSRKVLTYAEGKPDFTVGKDGRYRALVNTSYIVPKEYFVQVATSLWTITVGLLGGLASRLIHSSFELR